MEARTIGEPFLATLRISVKFSPAPPDGDLELWDYLMERLVSHPSIVDPVVSNDPNSGAVEISFEFEASGNAREDGLTALSLLVEATKTNGRSRAFDWEQWLGDPSSAGTVQYPVYA